MRAAESEFPSPVVSERARMEGGMMMITTRLLIFACCLYQVSLARTDSRIDPGYIYNRRRLNKPNINVNSNRIEECKIIGLCS